jgi:hypothetical protein
VVWAGPLEKSLEVVCRWSCLVLATKHGGHDAPHAEAICFLVIVVISHNHNPLRAPLRPLLAARKSSATSVSVAYWVAMLCNSSLVYLKMLFIAQKGGGCYTSCTLLPGAFGLSSLGSQRCPFRSLCLPWCRFCVWHSGCAPMSP